MQPDIIVAKSPLGAKTMACLVLAAWMAGFGPAPSADAQVRVSGTANALKVEAQGASLDDILRALQANFKFQYQGAGGLPDAVSGNYSGSLRSVVARLLAGHDFIIRGTLDDLSVDILTGKNGFVARTPPPANRIGNAAPPPAPPVPAAAPAKPDPAKECKAVIDGREVAVEC
jgi:hypothetical protein